MGVLNTLFIIIVTAVYHTLQYVSNKVFCKTIPLSFHFNKKRLAQFCKRGSKEQ